MRLAAQHIPTALASTKRYVAAIAVSLLAPAAVAGLDAATVPVQMQVVPVCRFEDTVARLDFGAIDVSRTAAVVAQTSLRYACTRGLTPVVSAGPGLHGDGAGRRRMALLGSGDFIAYSLEVGLDPRVGIGPGASLSMIIRGSIDAAEYRGAGIGDYSDTVVLTITP
jgi:spore coat protein U-like protein